MEFKKVENMPLSDKGMNEKLADTIEMLRNMKVGEIIEITDNETKPIGVKGRLKSATKRVPSATFKVRISKDKVYVRKESDLMPETNTEDKTEQKKKNKR